MITTDLVAKVKTNFDITDTSKDLIINDVIQEALNYCNLTELPEAVEPFIRRKVQNIINYESDSAASSAIAIKSISEGDTSITYNVDSKSTRETICGLSDADKKTLQKFRRLSYV